MEDQTPAGLYSVLKFVPDEVRFEPVNIGLVAEWEGHIATHMAEDVDPRIRHADPYVDVVSLRDFLGNYRAELYLDVAHLDTRSFKAWVDSQRLPNVYFSSVLPLVASNRESFNQVVQALFGRLVERAVERLPGRLKATGATATRTALRGAFRNAGVLNRKVETDIVIRGTSKLDWPIDFRYMSQGREHLIQAATTSLRAEVRRKQHGYEAFAALIDTARGNAHGILASDARANENEIAEVLARMCDGHGLRFVAGQREFYELARDVKMRASLLAAPEPDPARPQLV